MTDENKPDENEAIEAIKEADEDESPEEKKEE